MKYASLNNQRVLPTRGGKGKCPHSVEALGVIVELMHNSMSDNVRLAAACSLLNRGYGKPSITQIDDSVAHEITAFEVVADC